MDETRYYVTSLRTSSKALLQHVRDRWSVENSWHWPRDTQLKEDAHHYREVNGVQIMATLRSLAINVLGLDGSSRSPRGWSPWPTTSLANLRLVPEDQAIPLLLLGLEQETFMVRSLSCAGLGVKRNEAGWQALEEALEQAIEDTDGTVREGGTEIQGRLVRDWPGDAEAHQARLLLQQLQQDPDHQVIATGLAGAVYGCRTHWLASIRVSCHTFRHS